MRTTRVTIEICGLGSGDVGAVAVERSLLETPGVEYAYVSSATEMAYVEYDPHRTGIDQLVAAVERVGFRASEPTVR